MTVWNTHTSSRSQVEKTGVWGRANSLLCLHSEHDLLGYMLPLTFRAQADWTLTHTSHKDTEQSIIEASITLTDKLIR
jgi:hypothetical protein